MTSPLKKSRVDQSKKVNRVYNAAPTLSQSFDTQTIKACLIYPLPFRWGHRAYRCCAWQEMLLVAIPDDGDGLTLSHARCSPFLHTHALDTRF